MRCFLKALSKAQLMSGHLFVDETKRRDYLMVVGVVLPKDLTPARKCIQGLILPGQRRLHMKDERDSRKRQILSAIEKLDIEAMVYDAGNGYRTQRDARAACLRAMVEDATQHGHRHLILERDATLENWDRQQLIEATRRLGSTVKYRHETAAAEPLLAIPDALAWAYAKGGDWRRRSCIRTVRQV